MTDAAAEFFERLGRRGHDSRLERASGTICFELTHDQQVDRWCVEIADGDVTVSRDKSEADCVVRIDKAVFEQLAAGVVHPFVTWLKSQEVVHGDLMLLLLFERLYPDRPGARDPRRVGRTAVGHERGPAAAQGEDTAGAAVELVSILDGNNFVISDGRGDIGPAPAFPTGMFSFDTRYLSTWHLWINGQRVRPLSVHSLQYFEARFFVVPGVPTHFVDADVCAVRQRSIGGGLEEELTLINHRNQPADITVRLDVGSDFADVSEIENVRVKRGTYYTRVEDGCLRLGYERDTFARETVVSSTKPAQIDGQGLTFAIRLEARGSWTTTLHVDTLAGGHRIREHLVGQAGRTKPQMQDDLDTWLDAIPTLRCDYEPLETAYRHGLVDLAGLRFRPLVAHGHPLPAAGLPWFMTVFGRDSIQASLQALPFTSELAATTLRVLAIFQGQRLDDFRDEEPGKILHEIRYGESSAFEEQPRSFYYGAADTAALWLILLDEYEHWTGDSSLACQFEAEARKCLAWIDSYGDALGNGYVWYQRRNTVHGLENQCWKDSWDSISFHDGRLPDLPRATCEIQGYTYDAKIRTARLARQFWHDPGYADRLEREAADLKERFNRDFWIEDQQYYALALDPDGKQVDVLSSNIGHLLWSGIVEPDRAKAVAGHLLGPRLFSGWGVRTLATDAGRYNPVGYHVGTVWPFDNSFIAWGLRRYGFAEEAARIAEVIIDVSRYFEGRLPEAFGGYDRELTKDLVQYPAACRPYARSAGAVLLLLRIMLGLDAQKGHLVVEPVLPSTISRIELHDIPGPWGHSDAFGRRRG